MTIFNLQKYSKKCQIPQKTKGKIDTQLFPECEGTDQDRDVVKKNREKHTVEAARTKNVGDLNELLVGRHHDKSRFEEVSRAVNEAYDRLSTNANLGEDELESLIVADVAQKGYSAPSDHVDAIAASVIHNNKKKRKVNQALLSSPATISQPQPSVQPTQPTQANPVQANNKKQTKLADCGSSGNNVITVTYPKDTPSIGRNTDEQTFNIEVPENLKDESDIALAEWAYHEFQNENESHNARKTRSSMIGDVFTVRGKHYVVLGIGWAELSCDEFTKWKEINPRDRMMAFNESKLKELVSQAFTNTHMLKLAGKLSRK